jgi:hypothetical protein
MDWHIMAGYPDGNRYTVVFHFPVPSADNDAGRTYQECLAEMLGAEGTASVMPFCDGAEQTLLSAGGLYEVTEQFSTHPGETLSVKQARIDARYTARLGDEQDELQERLRYWGYGRDIP